MTAQLGSVGNANSLHASGRAARRVVEESRETVARALGCRPGEVVFTSGGTEADNLGIVGAALAARDRGGAMCAVVSAIDTARAGSPRRAVRPFRSHQGCQLESCFS